MKFLINPTSLFEILRKKIITKKKMILFEKCTSTQNHYTISHPIHDKYEPAHNERALLMGKFRGFDCESFLRKANTADRLSRTTNKTSERRVRNLIAKNFCLGINKCRHGATNLHIVRVRRWLWKSRNWKWNIAARTMC